MKNTVEIEMDKSNPIVRTEFAKEWMRWKPKSPAKKIFKNNYFSFTVLRKVFT
jgi:hypothetical protein